jgi:hypothetical protein
MAPSDFLDLLVEHTLSIFDGSEIVDLVGDVVAEKVLNRTIKDHWLI